jgi:anti-sigma regulatory factor (Ser/Thr protein kinase)
MTNGSVTESPPQRAFRHEALLYAGADGFVDGVVPFIDDALTAGEPVLVAVGSAKIDLLRGALGAAADRVHFANMEEVGRNPACIIPAWRQFLAERWSVQASVRGVGEPIWAGRGRDEIVECQHHESLLNRAFAGNPAWWLMCPYDRAALDEDVINAVYQSHPFVLEGGLRHASPRFQHDDSATFLEQPLPEPRVSVEELIYNVDEVATVRRFIADHAARVGLIPGRTADLVVAVNEVVTNSIRHASGRGTIRLWHDGDALVCEVRDDGRIRDPLVGRQRPTAEQATGRGLWLVNLLCDLVQVRSSSTGTVVRLRMRGR